MTCRAFLKASAAFAAAAGLDFASCAGTAAGAAFKADDYAAFRRELRAFYPDWGQGWKDIVKDPRQAKSYEIIKKELSAWCAAHPGYDALDVRRECYLAMRRHFVPFLFRESPFYFEAGRDRV